MLARLKRLRKAQRGLSARPFPSPIYKPSPPLTTVKSKAMKETSPIADCNQKYSDIIADIYGMAARGIIGSYDELFELYDSVNTAYCREMESIGGTETQIDILFRDNALAARDRGVSVRDYAFRMADFINMLKSDGAEFLQSNESEGSADD